MSLILFILYLIGTFLLGYNIVVLIKRREYENKRIHPGYNTLIFSVFILMLANLIKSFKFFLTNFDSGLLDYLLYFDIASNLILLPLFVISVIVAMTVFKEI